MNWSPIWQHFETVDNSHKRCRLCLITLKYCGSPTNFVNHLRAKHDEEYKEYLKEIGVHVNVVEEPRTKTSHKYTFMYHLFIEF